MSAPRTVVMTRTLWEDRVALLEADQVVDVEVERRDDGLRPGDVYVGRLRRILPGLDAAFVDLGTDRPAYLPLARTERVDMGALRRGQPIVVQVVKAPLGGKGARLSTRPIFPTLHWVLNTGSRGTSVSRKITDPAERERLLRIADRSARGEFALIARTAAAGRDESDLEREVRTLIDTWLARQDSARTIAPPQRIHREVDLPQRWLRDRLDGLVTRIIVTDLDLATDLERSTIAGGEAAVYSVEIEAPPLDPFARLGVDRALRDALSRTVRLPSGGHISIDPTEALTAIDVDTGRSIGRQSLEHTILETNLEAAREVARQVRLRNIGGIVIVDFIDMDRAAHREKVLDRLRAAFSGDPAPTEILPFTALGLVQLTRKRTRPTLAEQMLSACPNCLGSGRVPASSAVGARVLRKLEERSAEHSRTALVVRAAASVAEWLRRDAAVALRRIEHALARSIVIRADERLAADAFVIEPPAEPKREPGASPTG